MIRTNAEKIATVSLEDCLACRYFFIHSSSLPSGCVTSAETILIQQQSTSTFLEALKKVFSWIFVIILERI